MGMPENMLPGAGAAAPMPQDTGLPTSELSAGFPVPEMMPQGMDPALAMPPQMEGAIAQGPAMPDPTPIMSEILSAITDVLTRGKTSLNLDVMATAANTLATAYATLAKSMTEGGNPMLEMQKGEQELQIAREKADMEMEIAAQKLELEKAKLMLDMQMKKQQADMDAQIKAQQTEQQARHADENHQQTLRQGEETHRQNIATGGIKASLQVQESEAKRKQMEQGPKAST